NRQSDRDNGRHTTGRRRARPTSSTTAAAPGVRCGWGLVILQIPSGDGPTHGLTSLGISTLVLELGAFELQRQRLRRFRTANIDAVLDDLHAEVSDDEERVFVLGLSTDMNGDLADATGAVRVVRFRTLLFARFAAFHEQLGAGPVHTLLERHGRH